VKVLFRPKFWLDVEEGVAYLVENASHETASRWHQAVMATVQRVRNQPDLGRLRSDLTPEGLRSIAVLRFSKYLVFYRWSGEVIEVVRVKHGMMDLPRLFD
jgi:plasmid stabilization system protein ParE